MKKIVYPDPLREGDCIAVSAPSSGVEPELHHLLHTARKNAEKQGFIVLEDDTIWTDNKCVSAPAEERARSLQRLLLDDRISAVFPPWGGEFLMEILPLMDWDALKRSRPKWILGYSDISTFTFAYTLLTGHATAHGPNYIDAHSGAADVVTDRWREVLRTSPGGTVRQESSAFHQSAWDFSKPGFQLDTPTVWKTLGSKPDSSDRTSFSGRLIGGCLDTISILLGTPYAPVTAFSSEYGREQGLIWYLESCEMDAADIYRHLWQMKMGGWFDNCNGLLLGRPDGYAPRNQFELVDALHAVFDELPFPVIYDVDIGHVPPQLTLVNGALAAVAVQNGKGEVSMTLV